MYSIADAILDSPHPLYVKQDLARVVYSLKKRKVKIPSETILGISAGKIGPVTLSLMFQKDGKA